MAIGTPYSVCGGTGAAGAASSLQVTTGSGITGASGVSAGSAVVVALLGNSTSGLPNGCTDSQGNTYAQALLDTTRTPSLAFYVALNVTALTSGTDWIKGSYSGTAGTKALIARACTGIMGSPALDAVAHASSGSGTSPASGSSGTLKQASEWAVAAISNGTAGGTPSSWTGGFTAVNTQSSGSFLTLADQVVSSTAAVAAGATITTATWTCALITLRAATPPPYPVIPVQAAALIRAASW